MGSMPMDDVYTGDIAVIGMSCRFPGNCQSVDKFWHSIASGECAWREIPKDRFNGDAFWSPAEHRRTNTSKTKSGFFLEEDVAQFDAGFFTLPKAEVLAMDPQQRLLIEVAYEALEAAGLPLQRIAGSRTAVFVGVLTDDYYNIIRKDADNMPTYTLAGNHATTMAGRLSWLWDLHGPCLTLDTACSSSLVALHTACQSIRSLESDMAIVGGTNLMLSPDMFRVLSSASLLAPDGKSKAFDSSGDGYGRGEGIGSLVLKRVEDAVRDGDPIRAVIRGTSSNQDGHTKGLTLPDWKAQASLVRDAYHQAGLGFEHTGYVEAHGTGTQAGDQEETKGLSTTIAAGRSVTDKLLIGSVKSNIGHLEACAGLAAMIKAILVLEHGLIPSTITAKNINQKIPLDEWRLAIPTTLVPFPEREGIRRVSVNGFGFAGTNAHVIMDDAISYLKFHNLDGVHNTRNGRQLRSLNGALTNGQANGHANGEFTKIAKSGFPLVFSLSAQDKDGIDRVKERLVAYLRTKATSGEQFDETSYMVDLAHTLNARRSLHQWKSFVTASSITDLIAALQNRESPSPQYLSASGTPSIGFVFTGQGAQWGGMGMELMIFPTFAGSVRAADKYLVSELGCEWSAEEELRKPKGQSNLGIAEYSQTLCTVLQVALVDLLKEWGIEPKAVVGHSSGEIAAAYCLGALTKKDAWKIAFYRGVLSTSLKELSPDTHGAMMAVGTSAEKAEDMIQRIAPGQVTVACINSPSSVTLSGDIAGIERLVESLTQEGIFARKLQVDTAYHSHHMETIASDYLEAINDVQTRPGNSQCFMYSSCTGNKVQADELGAAHWVRNLVSPVRFAGAVQDIVRPRTADKMGERTAFNTVDILVEIGPHSALQGPSIQSLKDIGVTNIAYRSVLTRFEDGIKTALSLAGDLHAQSVPVRLEKVNSIAAAVRLPSRTPKALIGLPSYPWNHNQRYWAETRWAREQRLRQFPHLALLGAPIPSPTAGERTWRGYMRTKDEPWLSEHKIQGSNIYPAAGFLAMAIEAIMQSYSGERKVSGFHLRHVQFVSPMMIDGDEDVEFSIVLRPHQAGTMATTSTWTEFVVSSSPDGHRFERNCLGLIDLTYDNDQESAETAAEKAALHRRASEAQDLCTTIIDTTDFYTHLASFGLTYGPNFKKISSVCRRKQPGGGQSSGRVDVPNIGLDDTSYSLGDGRPHVVHPALLDAVIHMAFAAMDVRKAWIPKFVDDVIISTNVPWMAGQHIDGFCDAQEYGAKEFKANIFMQNPATQTPVIKLMGLCYASLADEMDDAGTSKPKSVCGKLEWKPALTLLDNQDLVSAVESEISYDAQLPASALSKLAKFIELLRHENPGLTISEVAGSDQILLPTLCVTSSVLSNGTYQCACTDDKKEALQEVLDKLGEQKAKFQLSSIKELLESNEPKPELLIASHFCEAKNIEEQFKSLVEGLGYEKQRTVCLIDTVQTADKLDCVSSANPRVVKKLQFTDEDFVVRVFSIQESKTDQANGHSEPSHVTILNPQNKSSELERFQDALIKTLDSQGRTATVLSWDKLSDDSIQDKCCISLVEFDKPLLGDLAEQDFLKIKQIVLRASHLTWVTGADDTAAGGTPMAALMVGVMRTLHNELLALQPLSILIDKSSKEHELEKSGTITADIFCGKHTQGTTSTLPPDHEFQIRNGVPYVCRVLEDGSINETLHLNTKPKEASIVESLPISAAKTAIELAVGKPGLIDSMRFEPSATSSSPLEEDDVEIAVEASGLNFREVMTIMGLLPSTTMGLEAAGTVTRTGSAVKHIAKGDRVALLGNGAHSTLFRSKASYAFKLPENMSFEEGASLPVTSYTAWYGIVYIARARKGQSILIHAGAGGVGQAALQIARHLGLEVYTTVGSPEKLQLVRDRYGVAEDHIFSSRDLDFAQGVKRMTNGRGVDIVLNSLAGESMRRSWECIAPGGHFVEIGLRDILENTRLDMRPFRYGATFSFFDLKDIWDNRSELMAEIVRGTEPLLTQGIIKPATPLLTHPISDMEKAVRLMQSGRHTGKIVLQWKPEHVVPTLRCASPPMKLDQDGVYVLVGGMGGLGRSLAKMLVSDGARKLCFLNRSRNLSKSGEQLLAELREKSIESLVISCDVSSASSLESAISQAESELSGPIRGCFQCAMVLRDVLFENMTYTDWIESTRPKVQGSKNLDDLLPETTDFFVMLSSFCGVFGNRGQANYVAGCGFQDALAHSRRTRGKHATSIDLGLMREVGRLAEEGAVGDIAEWEKVWGIREHEFIALMRLCMTPDQTGSQLPTGLGTKAASIAAGIKPPYYFDTDARFGVVARIGADKIDAGAETKENGAGQEALSDLLPKATNLSEATSAVLSALLLRVSKMLGVAADELDTGRFLYDYGVDSLAAIELVNWALRECQSRIAVFDVMAGVPMTVFSERVAAKSKLLAKGIVEGL